MHLLYTLGIFCDVLLIVIHLLLCVWWVGCWLHCIFTCLEIDILYTLAFSQIMELLYSRALWCQWKSLTIRVLGSGWLLEDPHSCSTHEADMIWNVQMSEVFADCVLNFGRVVQFFWLWNVVDWHNAFVIYFVYILWCSTDRDPRTSVRLVRWLLVALRFCIFWRSIYCASLPFRRRWSIHPREHLGARRGSGHSQCLAQSWLKIGICAGRMKQTCFEKVEHGETKSLLCKWLFWYISEMSLKWVKSLLILFWIFAELYNCWSIAECCRLAQCTWSLILCIFWIFCNLLPIVIHVILCFWWVGCWLHCIFTCLEIDILYTLAFSQIMELLYSRALWCQWKSLTIRVLGSGWLLEDPHSCSTHEADMIWNVQMSEVFADCVLNFGRVVQFFWLWNVVDWHNAFVIYFVYILWCSTDRDPRTSVRLVRWLLVALRFCIFLEIDILCILAFSQKMEHSSSRAPWCQKRIWALTVLGSVLVEDRHLCWAHETDMFWKSGTWRN